MPGKDMSRWVEVGDGEWIRSVTTVTSSAGYEEGIKATSAAVAAADELGIDLATVTGTGKDGQITKPDVEAASTED